MSRNLASRQCRFCGDTPYLEEPPRTITAADYAGWEEYKGMLVANAMCPACEAEYLAWIHYPDSLADPNLDFVDLSFRSTFNDEPGPSDMPRWRLVRKTELHRHRWSPDPAHPKRGPENESPLPKRFDHLPARSEWGDIREALGLLSSMAAGGESHSLRSRTVVLRAERSLAALEARELARDEEREARENVPRDPITVLAKHGTVAAVLTIPLPHDPPAGLRYALNHYMVHVVDTNTGKHVLATPLQRMQTVDPLPPISQKPRAYARLSKDDAVQADKLSHAVTVAIGAIVSLRQYNARVADGYMLALDRIENWEGTP